MASKRYKGRDCPYCGGEGITTTADHVVAREFFLEKARGNLPKVGACGACNNKKSELEHYVTTTLVAGSTIIDADLYRRTMVTGRLARNKKIAREAGFFEPPIWLNVNGIIQKTHPILIRANDLRRLMVFIAKGLHAFHFRNTIHPDSIISSDLVADQDKETFLLEFEHLYPTPCPQVREDLGRGTFVYEGMQCPLDPKSSIWNMTWHGGIALHGSNSPPNGATRFWVAMLPGNADCASTQGAQSG